jgi:2'-5' RNA ligase
MAQSVELLLDEAAELAVVAEWQWLRDAGLPTEWRTTPSPSHRPHVTLYAGTGLHDGAEEALPGLLADLDLTVELGAPLCFAARDRFVLVRQVVTTVELLALQTRVAELCGAGRGSHFGPGRFTPHVTLARRMTGTQVGSALDLLGAAGRLGERTAYLTRARRWDGTARRDWLL